MQGIGLPAGAGYGILRLARMERLDESAETCTGMLKQFETNLGKIAQAAEYG